MTLPRRWSSVRLRWAWNDPTAHLVAAQLGVAGAALVVNILAARALGPSGRGELALLLQIGYLSGVGLLLGTDRSGVVIFSGYPAGATARAFGRLLAVPASLGFCLVFALLLPLTASADPWWYRLALAIVFSLVNAFAKAVRSVAIASNRTREYLWCTIASQIFLLVLLCSSLLFTAPGSGTWLACYITSGLLVNGALVLRWLRSGGTTISSNETRSARVEGLVLLPSALATSGMLRFDRFILPLLASTAALGLYASVATMTEVLSWPLVAFADSRLGSWRRAADKGSLDFKRPLLWVGVYLLVGGGILIPGLQALLTPLLGSDFAASIQLIPVLVVAAAIFGLSRVLEGVLIAESHSSLASWAEAVGFVSSFALYLILIPPFAALGAAYGSLAGYSICALAAAVFIWRTHARAGRRALEVAS